jgi:ribosomal protein L19E
MLALRRRPRHGVSLNSDSRDFFSVCGELTVLVYSGLFALDSVAARREIEQLLANGVIVRRTGRGPSRYRKGPGLERETSRQETPSRAGLRTSKRRSAKSHS